MSKGIQESPNWVGYKLKPKMKGGQPITKPNGKPKMDKIPVNPHTGNYAKTNDPKTWADFDTAVAAMKTYKLNGVGLVFTKELGVVGIDLDDCVNEDGLLNDFALAIVAQLNSYTEYSPSGDGVHILVHGSIPHALKNGVIEMYDNGRFFTYTDKCVPNCETHIRNRQSELDQLFEQITRKAEPKDTPLRALVVANPLDDRTLLEKARTATNGVKFNRLWQGDFSEYTSQSEADYAFCHMLAFWTGNDETAIDRLFRQSNLFRSKWDEQHYSNGATYGEQTIAKAIANTTKVYQPLNGHGPETAVNTNHSKLARQDNNETSLSFSTFADIDREVASIEWAWPNWLSYGYCHLLASESGIGKSYLALRIAACFIGGDDWPDGTPFEGKTGCVIWCEGEAAQVLNKERAKTLGLPLDKLILPNENPFEDTIARNTEHQQRLTALSWLPDVQFIIVDSLSGIDPKDENSSEKLSIVKWFAQLARDTKKPILITHHLNKPFLGNNKVTLNRLRGSSAIPQVTRLVWALDVPDPTLPDKKRLSVIKNNLARFPEPIGLEIGETGISFGDAPVPPQQETKTQQAIDLFLALLGNGSMFATDLQDAFEREGISWATARNVSKKLGIKKKKQKGSNGKWIWSLPEPSED